jgi:hypothetical protein
MLPPLDELSFHMLMSTQEACLPQDIRDKAVERL